MDHSTNTKCDYFHGACICSNVHPHVPLNIANGKVYLEGDKVYTIVKQDS